MKQLITFLILMVMASATSIAQPDTILIATRNSDGKLIVDFRYIFDEDGWSQYDKTHVFDGHVTIENGNVIELEMDNIHVGVAAIVKYNPKEI